MLSYREAFERKLGVDPHTESAENLKAIARQSIDLNWEDGDRDTWLNLLMSHLIEPSLGPGLTFVYDYPASQAALARVAEDSNGQLVARRFEAFFGGMELANGYWELTDAVEQQRRFQIQRQSPRVLRHNAQHERAIKVV